jgi:hypothetical protein
MRRRNPQKRKPEPRNANPSREPQTRAANRRSMYTCNWIGGPRFCSGEPVLWCRTGLSGSGEPGLVEVRDPEAVASRIAAKRLHDQR